MNWKTYAFDTTDALAKIDPASLEGLAICLLGAWEKGRTVHICGNGGSANNANHLAQDLSKGTLVEGVAPMRTNSLCTNVGALTAWANDTSYAYVFSEQLRALGQSGDVLIAISGSGNSENVLRAVRVAHELEMRTWGVCGFDGGNLKRIAHRSVHVPSDNMGLVEAVHGVIFHWLVEYLKAAREENGEWIGCQV